MQESQDHTNVCKPLFYFIFNFVITFYRNIRVVACPFLARHRLVPQQDTVQPQMTLSLMISELRCRRLQDISFIDLLLCYNSVTVPNCMDVDTPGDRKQPLFYQDDRPMMHTVHLRH